MQKLVKPSADKKYVDLTVSFAPEADGEEDLPGPPVRYYFAHGNWWWHVVESIANHMKVWHHPFKNKWYYIFGKALIQKQTVEDGELHWGGVQ